MRIASFILFSVLLSDTQTIAFAENDLPPERLERRQSAAVTKLNIKMFSTSNFVMKDILILVNCNRDPVDLDGKITDIKGEATFIIQQNSSCEAHGGIHGFRQAVGKIEVGTKELYSMTLKQDITLQEYNEHLKNPE